MADFISFQPKDYFKTVLYTGNGSTQSITGVGFSPGLCWIKDRGSSAYDHQLYDPARGVTKAVASNTTDAESTNSNSLTSFDSDGFSLGSYARTNSNGDNKVAWNWRAGTTTGITTNGSTVITPSAYTFDQTAGFSAVKYTGNGNTTTKVAHGVGAAPKLLLIKNLDDGGDNWRVYHPGITNTTSLQLDNNGATSGGSDIFYDTDPDTVNFTLGNHVSVNNNGENYIAYCFAETQGFSRFGSYTGNSNSDGPFLYCGFKPALFVVKRYDTSGEYWNTLDSSRDPINPADLFIYWSENSGEGVKTQKIDFVSNGVKIRGTDGAFNASGGSYLYMALAEEPLVSSNEIAATAR